MTYFNRLFSENARSAAAEEIRQGEALFMADIAEVLSPEVIQAGVAIDFGANRARFEQVVELLDIDTLTGRNKLGVLQSYVYSGGGMTSYIGQDRVEQAVCDYGAATTLDYMHAEVWDVHKLYDLYPFITTTVRPIATTKIVFGALGELDNEGNRQLVEGTPAIALYAQVRTSPTSDVNDEWGFPDSIDLPRFVLEHPDSPGQSQRLFQKLLNEHAQETVQLVPPGCEYSLVISGRHHRAGDIFASDVVVAAENRFAIKHDRLVPYADSFQPDEDEEDGLF